MFNLLKTCTRLYSRVPPRLFRVRILRPPLYRTHVNNAYSLKYCTDTGLKLHLRLPSQIFPLDIFLKGDRCIFTPHCSPSLSPSLLAHLSASVPFYYSFKGLLLRVFISYYSLAIPTQHPHTMDYVIHNILNAEG